MTDMMSVTKIVQCFLFHHVCHKNCPTFSFLGIMSITEFVQCFFFYATTAWSEISVISLVAYEIFLTWMISLDIQAISITFLQVEPVIFKFTIIIGAILIAEIPIHELISSHESYETSSEILLVYFFELKPYFDAKHPMFSNS